MCVYALRPTPSKNEKQILSLVGLEPTTFGSEVQRAIHCATETVNNTPNKTQ